MGINNNNTSSKQSKYKRTMKITGLIASTLMLLLAVMASTASARSIAFPEPQYCCNAYTAECESCKAGVSVEEFCRTDPTFPECPTKQPPICCNAYNAKCESSKVYWKRSSAGYTLPFLSVLLRLQFVATP